MNPTGNSTMPAASLVLISGPPAFTYLPFITQHVVCTGNYIQNMGVAWSGTTMGMFVASIEDPIDLYEKVCYYLPEYGHAGRN